MAVLCLFCIFLGSTNKKNLVRSYLFFGIQDFKNDRNLLYTLYYIQLLRKLESFVWCGAICWSFLKNDNLGGFWDSDDAKVGWFQQMTQLRPWTDRELPAGYAPWGPWGYLGSGTWHYCRTLRIPGFHDRKKSENLGKCSHGGLVRRCSQGSTGKSPSTNGAFVGKTIDGADFHMCVTGHNDGVPHGSFLSQAGRSWRQLLPLQIHRSRLPRA